MKSVQIVRFHFWLRGERRHEGRGLSVLLGNGYERSHVLGADYMSNNDY